MDLQERENQVAFEMGHQLNQLVALPGYGVLLKIFEGIADTYEARLINLPSGESDQLLRDLHIEAKVAHAIFHIVQRQVDTAIEAGRQELSDQVSAASYRSL